MNSAILDGLTPGPLSVSCQLGFGTNRTQVSGSVKRELTDVIDDETFSPLGIVHRNVLHCRACPFRLDVGCREYVQITDHKLWFLDTMTDSRRDIWPLRRIKTDTVSRM